MLDALAQIKNSIQAYRDAMTILSSNTQNFQTDGYKGVLYSFQTIFSDVISSGGAGASGTGGSDGIKISQSMHLIPTGLDFTQGSIAIGKALNAAIDGQSLFMVKGTGNEHLFKRTSDFMFDNQGYLTDSLGRRVLGYAVSQNGVADKTKLIEIKLDPMTTSLNDVGFESNGILTTNYYKRKEAIDNKLVTIPSGQHLFQLALARFENPSKLAISAGGAYTATATSGNVVSVGVSKDAGLGIVYGGSKESSNVDASAIAIEGVQLQRGYNAVQSSMTMINRVLQDFLRAITS